MKWRLSDVGVLTPNITENCNKATEIENMISYGNLRQYNSITNKDENILDLVLSSDPDTAIKVTGSDEDLVSIDEYHPPLEITLEEKLEYMTVINHRKYNFRRANYDSICNELDHTDWCDSFFWMKCH